jgi:dephospho-CoA kinase
MARKNQPTWKLNKGRRGKTLTLDGFVLASSEEDALRALAQYKPGEVTKTRAAQERRKAHWGKKAFEKDISHRAGVTNCEDVVDRFKPYRVRATVEVVRTVVIGITGGIGAGKTTVSNIIMLMGYPVINSDAFGHEVLEPGQKAYKDVVKQWPTVVARKGGPIDRKKLADIVFSSTQQLRILEDLTHPHIRKKIVEAVDDCAERGHQLVFLEIPPIRRAGNISELDGMIIVKTDMETRIARVIERNNITREDVLKRIARQTPVNIVGSLSFMVRNETTHDDLKVQVEDAVRGLVNHFHVEKRHGS